MKRFVPALIVAMLGICFGLAAGQGIGMRVVRASGFSHVRTPGSHGQLGVGAPHFHYHAVATYRGKVMWTRDATNLVTRTGCTQLLTQTFKTQTIPTWYLGEIKGTGAPTFVTTDTMASHSGWTSEAGADITNGVRPTLTLGAVANGTDTVSVDNSGAPATFNQNSTITLQGFYLVDNNTVGGTAGNLYGEATFTAAPVAAGYIITITATLNTTAG